MDAYRGNFVATIVHELDSLVSFIPPRCAPSNYVQKTGLLPFVVALTPPALRSEPFLFIASVRNLHDLLGGAV